MRLPGLRKSAPVVLCEFEWQTDAEVQQYAVDAYVSDKLRDLFRAVAECTRRLVLEAE